MSVKFDDYRAIASLKEYVHIWQDEPFVMSFRCRVPNAWIVGPANESIEGELQFQSIGLTLPLAEIYAGSQFKPVFDE